MITEIILIIFAIAYYLFSIFFFTTIIPDKDKFTSLQILVRVLMLMIIAPILTPMILGIELGNAIRENNED